MTKMNCKFGGYSKTKKVLVIVCSNFTLMECYHAALDKNNDALAPLEARFRVLKFGRPNIISGDAVERSRSREKEPRSIEVPKGLFD